MMVTYKIIYILVLLERKTSAMERRLEKIKVKMNELYEKKLKNVEEKRAAPGLTGSGVFRCSMGRALLMLGILGILSSVSSLESEPAGKGGTAVEE
jgi:hypothetical protein